MSAERADEVKSPPADAWRLVEPFWPLEDSAPQEGASSGHGSGRRSDREAENARRRRWRLAATTLGDGVDLAPAWGPEHERRAKGWWAAHRISGTAHRIRKRADGALEVACQSATLDEVVPSQVEPEAAQLCRHRACMKREAKAQRRAARAAGRL